MSIVRWVGLLWLWLSLVSVTGICRRWGLRLWISIARLLLRRLGRVVVGLLLRLGRLLRPLLVISVDSGLGTRRVVVDLLVRGRRSPSPTDAADDEKADDPDGEEKYDKGDYD